MKKRESHLVSHVLSLSMVMVQHDQLVLNKNDNCVDSRSRISCAGVCPI